MAYQDYVDHVLADSPLLYWPLQETSGSAQDATANNRDGTVTSGGLWVPTNPQASRGDQAFSLPAGLTGATYLSYTGTMDTNAGNGMSVECWLKVDVSNSAVLMISDAGTNKFAMALSGTTGSVRLGTSGSTGRITVTDGATVGRWCHWVFTQDSAGSSRAYRNGVLAGGPSSQTVGADFPDLKVSNGTVSTVVTTWQHIAVFNTVLSAERIAARWALQAEDLYSFEKYDYMPAAFDTTVLIPAAGTAAPTVKQGQLWPRGNPG